MKAHNARQKLVFEPKPGAETFLAGAMFRRLDLPPSCVFVQADGTVQLRVPATLVGAILAGEKAVVTHGR